MPREVLIRKLLGWMEETIQPWTDVHRAAELRTTINGQARRCGITVEDMFETDPDAVLRYWCTVEPERIPRDNCRRGDCRPVQKTAPPESEIVYVVGPIEGRGDSYTAGPWHDRQNADWWTAKPGEAMFEVDADTGFYQIVDVWLDERMSWGEKYPAGWAYLAARGKAQEIVDRYHEANPDAAIHVGLFEAELRWEQERKDGTMATATQKTGTTATLTATAPAATAAKPQKNTVRSGAPPAFVEGENLDHLRAETGKSPDSVFVSVGKTINVGDYETVRVDIGRCAALKQGESFADAEQAAIDAVVARVMELENDIRAAAGQV